MPHKLLLADDSVTIQRVIELTFADEDVQVIAVGDGKQAIARVQSDRPDIVLADVGMPERDGYEVAAFIKGNPELAHIPVLLLTGAFEPIDETRARAVGCDGVLVKPFEPQMVINRVKDLLAGRRPQGLWAASPAAQTTVRQPAAPTPAAPADFDLRGPAEQPAQSTPSGSLEDYFDRLDAAFASLDAGATPAPPIPVVEEPVITRDHDFAPAAAPSESRSSRAERPAPSEIRSSRVEGPAPSESRSTSTLEPSAPAAAMDELSGWDPDLTGDPTRPATFEQRTSEMAAQRTNLPPAPPPSVAPAAAPPAPVVAPVSQPAASQALAPQAPLPSLAEAFAALLSAEQRQPVAAAKLRASMLSDEAIDDIVRRVAERMNDRAVKESVLDVAERLVREEIARIKGA
jgi:CheY-like chemotaxis protein